MPVPRPCKALTLLVVLAATPVAAAWKAASPEVSAARRDARIAAVLDAVTVMDRALVADDHAGFAALLADDLVVNNPQNTVSQAGGTARRSAAGKISYTQYERTIDYAGMRGDMVLLMGEEVCVAKSPNPLAGRAVRRRFTDLWKREGGRWKLTARQATIIDTGIDTGR